ncbi:S1 family peptidase [Dyella mobilis]|uniref:Trypsin-like peptidase domain-containing protein n=1 Tax=Dyella mobilis TaxID=1849582 RepID=A0ABS2KGL8_9GAMM|nr:serine protease [Dyella mobilis]MBM7130308.1 trypsin-like peptidase domain-containing protein [Dyella mobilis]GLQ96934.1 serine protease [Dyella mobilis]
MHHAPAKDRGLLRWAAFALLGAIAFLSASHRTWAASPDPSLVAKINAATFEVVIPRATDDPLSYEKPLPLDLLPYQERTDKYFSVGTAFALGNNRYITAGHVLMVAVGDLTGPPALRDASGHVYAIDKIEKFSLQQDFVMFSLKNPPSGNTLDVNTKPDLNSVVYAVGNALGTGVVIRDGLYTSDTPEEENGRWKWMRFSAAASPGNSGGPLLDQDGKVIGVVLMKSANENLNYALPIGEVLNAPDNRAMIDKQMSYQLDVLDDDQNGHFKAQFALPASYADFSATYLKLQNDFNEQQLKALLQQHGGELFPRGAGSNRILHDAPQLSFFPTLIVHDRSGQWEYAGRELHRVPLSGNGYVASGYVGHNFLMHLRRPDDVKAGAFYHDPKLMMDLVLKTGYWYRQVGPEKIKITSMGKPATESDYVDAWQRHWKILTWDEPHINAVVVLFALPVPDGYALMMRINPAMATHDSLIDMKALTDFFNVDYDGTLAQWKEFLDDSSLLPQMMKDTHLDADYGKHVGFDSDSVAFSYPSSLQTVAPGNVMAVGFGYFGAGNKFTMQANYIQIRLNETDPDRISIRRHVAPSLDLDDNFKEAWGKLLHKQHPYDGIAYSDGDEMDIATVIDAGTGGAPAELYTAFYATQGTHKPEEMKAKLDLLTKQFKIKSP